MAVNKVIYNNKVLIDLTADTITKDMLLAGTKAHDKSGAVITGTLLENSPSEYTFLDGILDSSGNAVLDSSSNIISRQIIYVKS